MDGNSQGQSTYPQSDLSFYTSLPSHPPDSVITGNTTDTPVQIPIYGIGVYVTDISSISLKESTFYADLRIYILKYYRSYDSDTRQSVLESALDESDKSRCSFNDGERWFFLQNVTLADVSSQKLLTGVNMDPFPQITPVLQPNSCRLEDQGSCKASDAKGTLDHIRVQSKFSFPPELSTFPFSTQTLPITLEFPSSTSSTSDYSFCDLSRYTGFSPTLSSWSTKIKAPSFGYMVAVATGSYPPFPNNHPSLFDSSVPPIRTTPRYEMMITVPTPLTYSLLTLLPSFIILITSILIYTVLPQKNYHLKVQALTTSLLAAVYQQSAINQSAVVSLADWFCLVVYIGVTFCLIGSGVDGWNRRFQEESKSFDDSYAKKVHAYFRVIPISSPVLLLSLLFGEKVRLGFVAGACLWIFFILSAWLYLGRSEERNEAAGAKRNDADPPAENLNSFMVERKSILSHFNMTPSSSGRRKKSDQHDNNNTVRLSQFTPSLRQSGSSSSFSSSSGSSSGWKSWGSGQFLKWLEGVGVHGQTIDILRREGLDGECLKDLTMSDLRSFGLNFKASRLVFQRIQELVADGGDGHDNGGGVQEARGTKLNPGPGYNHEHLYYRAEDIMKEKFGEDMMLPKPKTLGGGGTEVEMTTLNYEAPNINVNHSGGKPHESSLPTSDSGGIPPMPPEIQEIMNRRPDLFQKAMSLSGMKGARSAQQGGQEAGNGGVESSIPSTQGATLPTKLSKIQANMLGSQRGYAERFAGAAAAAEMDGVKIAPQKPSKYYEDDDDKDEADDDDNNDNDGISLLNSKRF